MSLLLDALKKSGHYQNTAKPDEGHAPPSAPGLTLEELPPSRQPGSSYSAEPGRAAGENLFAAKKKPTYPRGRMKLGIVPITLIAASIFAAGYGYYVWREISGPPPAARPVTRPAPPSPAPVAPVAATAPAPLPAPPVLAPLAQAPAPAEPVIRQTAKPQPRARRQRAPAVQIEKKQVDTITPLLQDAYAAYRQGDLETARQKYRLALQQDARNHDALAGLAAIARQQGQDALAAEYYQELLELDPRDAAAQAGMSTLLKEGASAKESRLKQLIDQQPQSPALHFALGNLYAEQARWAEAQQAYFNAYSLQMDAAQYALNLAISLDHLGQSKLAAQYYLRALQLDGSANTFDHAQAEKRLGELGAP